jgi:diacylglycerol kinase (ATP)
MLRKFVLTPLNFSSLSSAEQKQCQIAVLPLGTGNDLARVLGWGSACDDDAHLPQLLDRYEKSSTKMLDRWSIMVFERGISLRRGMSISHSPDAILSQFEDNAMWHLQVQKLFFLNR